LRHSCPQDALDNLFKVISDAVEKKDPVVDTAALFADFDSGHAGSVSKPALADAFGARFDLHLADDKLDLLLLEFDNDGSDSLDSDEFTKMIEEYELRVAATNAMRTPTGSVKVHGEEVVPEHDASTAGATPVFAKLQLADHEASGQEDKVMTIDEAPGGIIEDLAWEAAAAAAAAAEAEAGAAAVVEETGVVNGSPDGSRQLTHFYAGYTCSNMRSSACGSAVGSSCGKGCTSYAYPSCNMCQCPAGEFFFFLVRARCAFMLAT
jgi:hypothetical protein